MVSILVPVYNAQHCVGRCLDSILEQTYKDLEVILVNDGSKDDSLSVIKKYSNRDRRVKVINQKNNGVAAARNTALKNATGQYVLYVDADDWIEVNMIQRMLELIRDADIVFCGNDHAGRPKEIEYVADVKIEYWDQSKQLLEFMKHKQMTGMLWNKMMKRSLIEEICFDEKIGYGEDARFLWEVLKKSQKMVVTNEILYHHVLDKNSISHQAFNEKKYSAISMWEEIVDEVQESYPQFVKLAKERLMAATVVSCYEIRKSNYQNKEHKKHLREVVRKNLGAFLESKNISVKMKLYAVIVFLGI